MVADWQLEGWREGYRRLDSIAHDVGVVITKIDNLSTAEEDASERLFRRVHRIVGQRVRFDLDITGLRADEPLSGEFEAMFVEPEVTIDVPTRGTTRGHIFRRRFKKRSLRNMSIPLGMVLMNPCFRYRIFGAPGAGKSTWTKWLQLREFNTNVEARDGKHLLPVRVVLRSLSRQDRLPSWHNLLREAVGPHLQEELAAEYVRQWVEDGRILWILDGFDEIAIDRRTAVQEWLLELSQVLDACPLLVTSRPLSTKHLQELGERWYSAYIHEFDKQRIVDYIERWYRYRPLLKNYDQTRTIDAHSLMEAWNQDPTVQPLTGNPLLLSTLLMVHHLDGELPSGRSELYRRYVDGMLGLWDKRRGVATEHIALTSADKRRILQKLAIYMQTHGTDELEEETATQIVSTVATSDEYPAESILAALRERSGLLIGPGVYTFVHKSVAEYLVAEAIVDGVEKDSHGARLDRFRLFRERSQDRWRTILYFWAGLAPKADVESLIGECLATRDPSDFVLAVGLMEDRITSWDRDAIRRFFEV